MRYRDIDWNRMWQESRSEKSWQKKKSQDWDKRAAGFAERNLNSPFAEQFLAALQPESTWSVLDVGSGPGTLALPLARRVQRVTALDYSPAMLAELRNQAGAAGLDNITAIQASWLDDWDELAIGRHDIAIASRSLSVDDLAGALAKLDRSADQGVYIVDRVGAGPFDPDLFLAIGRDFDPGPDYIFTLNILYTMQINARVDFITLDHNRCYHSREEALKSYRWMVDNLTPAEDEKLIAYVDARLTKIDDNTWRLNRRIPPKWALIQWRK
ncbi:MAG: class I SAM-dependent methyltransferase [Desulfobulbaceae bacterium]|nr:class I SAM-dependent methyltransferase [Desulfobulbaceae bacterium]HIJ78441.1 class I SAM-dependent methyltransferase [Deltaproteobacteria bacterium]